MKIVNVILGLAAAIILGSLITLGIKTFYPEPIAPTYPIVAPTAPCATGDVVCISTQNAANNAAQSQWATEEQAYESAMKVYNKNLFIIANILGLVVFAIGFWLVFGGRLVSRAVPIGVMVAGLWSVIYGYGRGWGSVNDQLKFFVGLVIALVIIGGSMWLMERYQRSRAGQVQ